MYTCTAAHTYGIIITREYFLKVLHFICCYVSEPRFTCEQHEDFFFANKDGATLKPGERCSQVYKMYIHWILTSCPCLDPSASVEDSLVTVPPEGFTTVNSSIPKSSCGEEHFTYYNYN